MDNSSRSFSDDDTVIGNSFIPYSGTNDGDDRSDTDESYEDYINKKIEKNKQKYIDYIKDKIGEEITDVNVIPEIMVEKMKRFYKIKKERE